MTNTTNKPSTVVQANIDALIAREQAGVAEYGDNLDRTDMSAARWLSELIDESLDRANYGRKLLDLMPRMDAAVRTLENIGYTYHGAPFWAPPLGMAAGAAGANLQLPPGLQGIADERRRQISEMGFNADHDDNFNDQDQLIGAALAYLIGQWFGNGTRTRPPVSWPWDADWWKPKDRRRDLERAGALIAAEIARMDRLAEFELARAAAAGAP